MLCKYIKANKPIIYIAGKLTDTENHLILANIEKAYNVFIELLRCGIYSICPHTLTTHIIDAKVDTLKGMDYEIWIEYCFSVLQRCDAVLMLDNWQDSYGAKKELSYTKKLGLPIYYSVAELKAALQINL